MVEALRSPWDSYQSTCWEQTVEMYWGWSLDGFGILIIHQFPFASWRRELHIPRRKLQVGSNCLTQRVICGELVKSTALSGGAGDHSEGVPCYMAYSEVLAYHPFNGKHGTGTI